MPHSLPRTVCSALILWGLSYLSALFATAAPGGDVPKGEVNKYTFENSKIFPGTTRDYWAYVPKQYDPAKPACVHVNQDGVQYNAPAVFDELIHKQEIPVLIGVFVMHGRVKATQIFPDAMRWIWKDWPDQSLLYVADSRTHWVFSYQIEADGSLAHKQRYYHLHMPDAFDDSGADGMRTDKDGRLYVATRRGLQVCDQAGRVNCIIPTPNGKISNLTFGGEKFDTIFATCGERVYSRKVKVQGSNGWQPPHKPAAPRL